MRALDQPITIIKQEAAAVNRLDIEVFTVDAVSKVVSINGRGLQVDGNGQQIGGARLPETRVGDDAVFTLMAAGAKYVTVSVLTALGVAPELIAEVQAGCDAHTDVASAAYYNGTRDALYDAVERALADTP